MVNWQEQDAPSADRSDTLMDPWYQEEQENLSLIREGIAPPADERPLPFYASGAGGVTLDEARAQLFAFITLASRAAMEGGMEPARARAAASRLQARAGAAASQEELALLRTFTRRTFAAEVRQVRLSSAGCSPAVAACLSYIASHLETDATLQEAAESLGLTPYYLGRKFKRETGRTFGQVLLDMRIERAAALLSHTDLTAAQVSDRLRFADPSYFGKCFRRRTGRPPGRYRNGGPA